jgi:hypothetical protein
MKTVTIQIGNTDNKLTQQEWAEFVSQVKKVLEYSTIHFFGGSPNWEAWQNAAWVFSCENEHRLGLIKENLVNIRKNFNQESVAWSESITEFI